MVATAEPVDSPTAADIRIALALRPRVRAYRVAARTGITPFLLSRMLNGHYPIGAGLALRIHAAILVEEAVAAGVAAE